MKIIFLFIFISCSHSIVVKTPVNRFLSAESQGEPLKGTAKIFMGLGMEAKVDLRNEKTDNSLILSRNNSQLFFDPLINGELGIWGPLDLFHIGGGRMGADLTGAKFQLYGDHKNTAKKNNFSVSLLAGYGGVTNNVEDGEDFEFIPLDDDTTSELMISNHTAGLLVGYRTDDNLLVNLGYHSVIHNFHGKLESQNVNLDGKTLNYKGHSALLTLGAFLYNKHGVLGLEFTNETIKWDKTQKTQNLYTNFSFGFHW